MNGTECNNCAPLSAWSNVSSPSEVHVRVLQMAAMVGDGFEEISRFTTDPRPPEEVTESWIVDGAPWDHKLDSHIEIRCRKCGRGFTKTWHPGRWVVAGDPPNAPPL